MQAKPTTRRAPRDDVVRVAASVLFLAVMAAAGERSLAPFMAHVPDDRTAADVQVTQAAYRNVTSPAPEPDAAPQTQPDV